MTWFNLVVVKLSQPGQSGPGAGQVLEVWESRTQWEDVPCGKKVTLQIIRGHMPEVQPSWSLFQVLQEAPREETQGGVGQVQQGVGIAQHRVD